MKEWIVSGEGPGDFATIGEALRSAEVRFGSSRPEDWEGVRILVRAGLYREKLKVMAPGVELAGEGSSETLIVWDDCASRLLPDGQRMGTFNSYTLYVGAPRVTIRDLSVVNAAGDGRLVGQAVALYADADLFLAEDCRLSARQDTLCTGPLPKNPAPKGVNLLHPVAGLGEDEPALPFRQLYRRCRIEGDVDFIFGSSLALFEDCEIRSLARPPLGAASAADGQARGAAVAPDCGPDGATQGWIAAPSTYPGQSAGFVFRGCELTAEEGTDRVYLGRPWRHTGRTAFVGCRLGAHIAPEGWDDWGKPEARAFGGFAEYGSTGPGASRSIAPRSIASRGAAPRSPAPRSPDVGGPRRVAWARDIPAVAASAPAAAGVGTSAASEIAALSEVALFGENFAGR